MSLFGNIGEFIEEKESWTQYTERLNQFFRANDIVNEEKKAAIFLSTIGSSAYKVLGNLLAPKKPAEESYTRMVEVMKSFYNPTPSVTIQRFRFYSRFRQPGESILAFVAELRSLAKDCEFGASLEENLRDRLVCGVSDPVIQKRLLSEEKLTYKKACELAQGLESAARDIKTLQGSTQSEVHKLKTSSSSCYRCGKLGHTSQNCQFKSAICHYCGKLGHIRSVCLSRTRSFNRRSSFCSSTSPSTRSTSSRSSNRSMSSRSFCPSTDVVKTLKEEHEGNSEYTLFTIPAASSRPPLYTTVSVDKQQLTMEVDTGASFSVISRKTYQKLFSSKPLQQSNVKLKTYSGEPLPVHGSITVEVCEGTQNTSLNLLVVGDSGPSLLGRDWMHCLRLNWNSILHLQVHSLNNLLQKHSDVFKDELGTLKDFEAKIYIDPGANPRFCKARPVPYAYCLKVEAELDRLIEQNIIEPIPFSDWAAPIVPVLKADNTIRICGDYKVTVNQVSKLDRYPIPKIEDLFAKLSGGTVFTKLDLSQAYQQLMLDEESKKYVVINTHRGLFRYNRLPFGISSAPGIFQRTMESLLQGIPKVVVYLDDILVTGLSEEDHLLTLQKVLQRIESSGLRLKKNKCKFMVPSISYLGYKIDAQGLHPLPEKMDAIMKAPSPTSLTELKSFLGLLSYYGKFIPNMSTVVHPLYDLLKKSTKWKWTEDEEQAFKLAKELLTSNSVLIHFDPGKEVLLSCDASAYGIGAVLSHRLPDGTERPIGFSSRTLSAAEQKYSQIEKETLACVFGVKRFHSYLFGHRFTLITDHKPLLTLINAHRAIPTHTSNRIQRWALTLSMYEYSISFKSTATHGNADALSRLPLPETSKDPPVPAETVLLLEQLSESPISVKQIKLWTRRDPTLSRVLQFTLYGWPDKPPEDPAFKPYWTRKLELSTQDGVLLWGNRVVVPIPGRLPILDHV